MNPITRPHWKKIALALKAHIESHGHKVVYRLDGAEVLLEWRNPPKPKEKAK